jgi:hypothetical protein
MALFPNTLYFLYLDSDAVVAPEYVHISIPRYVAHAEQLGDSLDSRPVMFGQELGGHGFSYFCEVRRLHANSSCVFSYYAPR